MRHQLTPIMWNAPGAPYDGKPRYANHIFHKMLRWDDLHALPKEQQRSRIFRCDTCGGYVAWTKNAETGRNYLCEIVVDSHTYRGKTSKHPYFDPSKPHWKSCGGQ